MVAGKARSNAVGASAVVAGRARSYRGGAMCRVVVPRCAPTETDDGQGLEHRRPSPGASAVKVWSFGGQGLELRRPRSGASTFKLWNIDVQALEHRRSRSGTSASKLWDIARDLPVARQRANPALRTRVTGVAPRCAPTRALHPAGSRARPAPTGAGCGWRCGSATQRHRDHDAGRPRPREHRRR